MEYKINKDMTFAEVIEKYPKTSEVFFKYNMGCIACPLSRGETLEQGCHAHGLDVDKFIDELNRIIKK